MNNHTGLPYALLAYVIWGLAPIYWKQIEHIDSLQIVMHRMAWSFVFILAAIFAIGQWRQLVCLLRNKTLLKQVFLASVLISINWGIFIWAVNDGHIVEASMGYFINPLITVLFGVIVFGERLRGVQLLAIVIVAVGIGYLIIQHQRIPWIALSLAVTFACYSVLKKSTEIAATSNLAIETGLMFLPSVIYILFIQSEGAGSFGSNVHDDLYLIFAGLVSLVPLVLFAFAAPRISMTALGMSQYIGPTLQLVVAIYLYNEPFDQVRLISFGLIWLALLIYTVDQILHRRRLVSTSLS